MLLLLLACSPGVVMPDASPEGYACGDTVTVNVNVVVDDEGVAMDGDCREALPGGAWDLDPCCPDGYTGISYITSTVTCLVVCS